MAVNPQEQVQEFLSQCRSYSSSEMGSEPDWVKAEGACSKALDIDPINTEANTLMRRIKVEKEAANYFALGLKALARLKEEEALDDFKKITKDSSYFRRAKPKVQEAVAQVMKRSEDDCKRYLRDNAWSAAVPRCERYMGIACQKMTREELEPPIGFTLVLERGRRLKKTEWRPQNKLYLDFLSARQRMDANAPPWHCPVSDITAEEEAAPDPKKLVEDSFKQRYPNKFMLAAMLDYWGGRTSEAIATLQRVRNNYELSQLHSETDKLLTSVGNVYQLYNTGEGYLQNEDVEKAAEAMQEALEVDKTLMAELVDTRPSFFKRNIQQDMASKAIVRGKYWDERGDQRHACRVWKLGFRFYAGNTDLNSQVGKCSTRGLKAFKTAESCSELDIALEYAVPGDGLENEGRREEEGAGLLVDRGGGARLRPGPMVPSPPSGTPRLVLIDASSFIFRAYHAIPPLTTRQGVPTNATLGFTRHAAQGAQGAQAHPRGARLRQGEPRRAPEDRSQLQGQPRRPAPDLIPQFALHPPGGGGARRCPCSRCAGWEADDVIGTLAQRAKAEGFHVLVVTGDKDFVQIVDEDVHALRSDAERALHGPRRR